MLESWQVVSRYCVKLLLAGGLATYSVVAPALGLGEITVRSALNQPLRADIALVDAAGMEEGDLSVTLATADEFGRAGVERVFFLNNLRFTPVLRGNRSVIQVSSSKPVDEPFLNFLVQLNQPNGRILREYTVLIDPPGSPGIAPTGDGLVADSPESPFPSVKPANAPPPATKKAPKPDVQPLTAPTVDPMAEQLAASVLQNQQLQHTLDELNSKLLAQDEQIAGQKKQVIELETRLAEIRQAPLSAPAIEAPPPVALEPVAEQAEGTDWPMMIGLAALVALLLGLFIHRRRQAQAVPEDNAVLPAHHEPVLEHPEDSIGHATALKTLPVHQDDAPAGDVLEGVGIYIAYGRFAEAAGLLRDALAKEPQRTDLAVQLLEVLGRQGDASAYEAQENSLRDAGFDAQQLQDIRARYPKLNSAAPVTAAVPVVAPTVQPREPAADEFQLNLDDLSMDSSWDLISPFDAAKPASEPAKPPEPAFASNLHILPDVFEMPEASTADEQELEWIAEPEAQALDDAFLEEFSDPAQSFELEPLVPLEMDLEPYVPAHADKLEQAQTCIDDGDIDSAIELLNELLEDGDEPLKQTARTLLAGIR